MCFIKSYKMIPMPSIGMGASNIMGFRDGGSKHDIFCTYSFSPKYSSFSGILDVPITLILKLISRGINLVFTKLIIELKLN